MLGSLTHFLSKIYQILITRVLRLTRVVDPRLVNWVFTALIKYEALSTLYEIAVINLEIKNTNTTVT